MDRDLIKQQLEHALEGTNFDDQGELYKGKVRDNYINEDTIQWLPLTEFLHLIEF